ncbi:hypothetical protein [Micromonospora sp. NBC_01638]|uniref:hypothetical protein n=1 Tax=Micromonospora sp. NBC_01638 TaxID=2975982 RepID=UPI00386AC990|nr:hypothetical protein OG811_28175 [Micromonospora sp. NBC_01638]
MSAPTVAVAPGEAAACAILHFLPRLTGQFARNGDRACKIAGLIRGPSRTTRMLSRAIRRMVVPAASMHYEECHLR